MSVRFSLLQFYFDGLQNKDYHLFLEFTAICASKSLCCIIIINILSPPRLFDVVQSTKEKKKKQFPSKYFVKLD